MPFSEICEIYHSNPEPIEENLQELIKVVKELGSDIDLAHDGDADRTICIDEKGNIVLGDKIFTPVEKKMLKENDNGIIVTTVTTSHAIYDKEIKETTDFKLDLTYGIKNIKPSGIEPIFRCFAESNSQEKIDEKSEWGINLIKKYEK